MKKLSVALGAILLAGLLAACGSAPRPTVPPPTSIPEPTAAPAPQTDVANITDILWKWEAFQDSAGQNDISVPNPDDYTLTFLPGGELSIKADCNTVGGSYTAQGASLAIELGAATMAYCGDDSLDQQYLSLLGQVSAFVLDGDRLMLNLQADAGNMVWANGGPAATAPANETGPTATEADILDQVWQWAELIETAPASQSVVPDPESYLLILRSGGEFLFRADCNNGSGTYSLEGASISLEPGAMTMALCGEDSLDARYLELLGSVANYTVEGERLVLGLRDDAGRMIFDNGGPAEVPATSSAVGIDLGSIRLDTRGLPYSWQASAVPTMPYDVSQPLGPVGLPEHIQISFAPTDVRENQYGEPVIYIIPVETYKQLWEVNGDPSISYTLDHIAALMADQPSPIPPFGMPVLPYEEIGGVNDLAAQGSFPQSALLNGVRFVGRFAQDPNPVTNEGLRCIFQGFSSDGQYFIAFFYPVTTDALPQSIADVPAKEQEQVASNLEGYLEARVEMLNALAPSDWEPDLSTLDAVLGSLQFETTGVGEEIVGILWQWSELYDVEEANPLLIPDPENYTLALQPGGQYSVKADCNTGSGTYTLRGQSLALEAGPLTTAFCGEDSLDQKYLALLGNVAEYGLDGERLILILQDGAGSMVLTNGGPAPQP